MKGLDELQEEEVSDDDDGVTYAMQSRQKRKPKNIDATNLPPMNKQSQYK